MFRVDDDTVYCFIEISHLHFLCYILQQWSKFGNTASIFNLGSRKFVNVGFINYEIRTNLISVLRAV